ncbi:hypothetical protein M758_11G027300 [Ceratodon purpureus]|nr:hypothetical protein M758_11G027300 [Ceratodon purpureus]
MNPTVLRSSMARMSFGSSSSSRSTGSMLLQRFRELLLLHGRARRILVRRSVVVHFLHQLGRLRASSGLLLGLQRVLNGLPARLENASQAELQRRIAERNAGRGHHRVGYRVALLLLLALPHRYLMIVLSTFSAIPNLYKILRDSTQ